VSGGGNLGQSMHCRLNDRASFEGAGRYRGESSMASPARVISVEARPGPLTIDLTFAAVLVVDMQNDFGAQGGMFERAGIDISVIQRAVDPTRCVIAAARNAGVRIVVTAQVSSCGRSLTGHG
jgi:hypothetical protein